MIFARLLKCCAQVVDHRVGNVPWDRCADEAAHGDHGNSVGGRAGASLKQNLAETRDRFWFSDAADALKRRDHQDNVHEQAGTKRDEQEDAETTQPAIGCHTGTKLEENCPTDKRFCGSAEPSNSRSNLLPSEGGGELREPLLQQPKEDSRTVARVSVRDELADALWQLVSVSSNHDPPAK